MKKNVIIILYLAFMINGISFAQERYFNETVLTNNETNVSGLFISDINNDNKNDIISSAFNNEVAWWQNNGDESFTKHIVDNGFNGGMYVYVTDINNDSFQDVVVSGANTDGPYVLWYKNNGTNSLTWERIIISTDFANGHGIYAGDIDNDGDMDVIASSEGDDKISWFENTEGDGSLWEEHVVISDFPSSQAVCAADLNNDGFLDLIGASSEDHQIKCMLNNGKEMIEWTDSLVDDEILLPHWVDTIDMDSDGDVDIYASGFSSHEISWYENDTENKKWIKHNVTTNIPFTLAVTAGDMDNDSDIDFIGTSPNSGQVIILENEGDNISFNKHTITNNMLGAWPVCVGYITDDEYLDIAAGANNLGKISWFKNDTVNTTSIYFKEIEITQNIEVFPNPAKDVINIKMELTEKSVLKIELFDITGKKIDETETLYTNQKIFHKAFYLNDNIESGIYFLKIRVNNIVQTKHIIIG